MPTDSQNTGPDVEALAGERPADALRRWFLATRPMFLSASLMPFVVGMAWGFRVSGRIELLATIIACVATLMVHAASNVYNDVGDDHIGTDKSNTERIYPFTGGSQFIQSGVMSATQMYRLALGLFAAACLLGLWLVWLKGIYILVFGVLGVASGVLYSMPKVMLSGRGLGETVIAIAFGLIPLLGAAWLQTGVIDGTVVLIAVPVSLWIAAVLLVNEIPDMAADARAEKRTLPVRWGLPGTRRLYRGMHGLAAIAILVLVWVGQLPPLSLVLAALLLLLARRAGECIVHRRLLAAIKMTLAIHALGSLGLTLLILWGG